ncbi:MAG: phosphoenolpyruvate--protein phosphotransferase [Oceanisphaera sp.]|uniref:phosphoenolpyruvate--protein phosphotransferase n=1 Tax=Oceanisphaera sp. TaxID=1929979 RepID=UPI003C767558
MLALSVEDIRTDVNLADKNAVIQALAQWLEQEGHVASGYQAGMLAREAKIATYLGQGIAIPHGTQECRHLIKKTGIKVLHLPQGVEWGGGEIAYLVLGIAARSDEHLDILKQLATTLSQGDLPTRIKAITQPQQILQLLQNTPALTPTPTITSELLRVEHIQTQLTLNSLLALTESAMTLMPCTVAEQARLKQTPSIHIGQGWWLSQNPADDGHTKAALVTPYTNSELMTQQPPVRGLLMLVIADLSHKVLLDQLLVWLKTEQGAELAAITQAHRLLAALQNGPPVNTSVSERVEQAAIVRNTHGIHARPGAILVQVAKQYAADVRVRNQDGDGQWVSAKSLMKMISLGTKSGHQLLFSAAGKDADLAVAALVNAVEQGLGETLPPLNGDIHADIEQQASPANEYDVTSSVAASLSAAASGSSNAPAAPASLTVPLQSPLAANTELTGVSAAGGIAIGPIFVDAPPQFNYLKQADDVSVERAALAAAISLARSDLAATQAQSNDEQGRNMLAMHRELLADSSLSFGVHKLINEGLSAAAAWWSETDTAATRQAANTDALLAERAADIRDVGRRVMAILCQSPVITPPDHPYIWVAQDIGPSQLVNLDPQRVLGIVTVSGGAFSHSAILASALGIPALAAVNETVMSLRSGTDAILNGDQGSLRINPDPQTLEQAQQQHQQTQQDAEQAWALRRLPAITEDQHSIEVGANLSGVNDASRVVMSGSDGVGLLRTEFVFMSQHSAPNLATQTALYRRLFDDLEGRPLLVRTLDVGGDKPLPYWPVAKEDNPFLGVRGIRLCMQRPELLATQIRALLTAANDRPVRIMFPMITDISEWRWAKRLVNEIQDEIKATQVELGIMIEVPAAALNAAVFAKEVDFFSIGTNDLTQYTLAIDRGNGEVAHLADALHPSVLQLIKMTVDAAHAQGKWVGVCGELAADTQALPVLLGLGIDKLSVSLKRVALIKEQVRRANFGACQQLAARALLAEDAPSVRRLLEKSV